MLSVWENLSTEQVSTVLNLPVESAARIVTRTRATYVSFLNTCSVHPRSGSVDETDGLPTIVDRPLAPTSEELATIRSQLLAALEGLAPRKRVKVEGVSTWPLESSNVKSVDSSSSKNWTLTKSAGSVAAIAFFVAAVIFAGRLGSTSKTPDREAGITQDQEIAEATLGDNVIYGLSTPPQQSVLFYDPEVNLITYASEERNQFLYINTQERSDIALSEVEQPQCAAWWQYHCDVELSERQSRTIGGSWQRLTTRLSPELTIQIDAIGFSEDELVSFGDDLIEIEPTDLN